MFKLEVLYIEKLEKIRRLMIRKKGRREKQKSSDNNGK